ncbi:MAG: SIR2 family NAD-dependent protein deacylase [Xenococcaceae cyanobacterium]
MSFPDQHHVEQIRQRLWCGREFGQAAIMVGAGFSCNADKISATSSNFPLWWDLEKQMRNHLPSDSISANLDALELATEYEKAFGRQKLEQFLIDSVPDKQYNPGKLHELLLSLPWSDVFTTNYDTLLERTFILDRKYEVIYNPSDIPGRMKPRIVKLHGSFDSYRPFIFTQQDYESYPSKFAPFVNMVQQSIMENAFCLIGFSGEDPNFLKWIEWVRNNLNEYSPPIYLCGLLNISNYQKQILKSRKVTTIELSPLFPKEEWQDRNLRHSKALEWFLLNLMYGGKYINWTSKNAEDFLNTINIWWNTNKNNINEIYNYKSDFFYKHLQQAIRAITSCLSKVILPRLRDSEEDIKQQAKKLIAELEEVGISVLSILPMTLFIETSDVFNNITRKLRLGLSSLNLEDVDSAIVGIEYWLICSQQKQIIDLPPELLNDLVNKVFHRRLPRLNFAIYILGHLIKKFPNILNQNQLESLLFSLEFILQETQLPNNWQDWQESKLFNKDINTIIEIEDRPEYMRLTAYLALQLYQIFEGKGAEIPEILIKWKDASLSSVLPQVRRVWEKYSLFEENNE